MDAVKRHKFIFPVLTTLITGFFRHKFNYEYDDLRDIPDPYLLLPNHNLEMDPILVGIAAHKQIYFVASEHIMRKGILTKLLMYVFKPIIHKKGQTGISSVKDILRTLKDGSSVCLFPEGNRSFNGLTGPVVQSTGKLARSSGVPLVTYRLEGGYLSQPRWSTTLRRGRLRGRLVHIYSPEELKAMTPAEVTRAIERDLAEDAYATEAREQVPFKGRKLAYGLESAIFICPKCGKAELRSDDTSLSCVCGWSADYDEFGILTDGDGHFYTVTELDRLQKVALADKVASAGDEDELFSDEVRLFDMDDSHGVVSEETGRLSATKHGMSCCGRSFPFGELEGFAIYSRNSLIINSRTLGRFEVKSDNISFCGLKYVYLYDIVKNNA